MVESTSQCQERADVSVSARSLLREIHHQVKNNLQIVSSLLRIQSRGLVESDARAVCKRSEERIQCMALVYDALYRGSLLEGVSLRDYLPTMVQHLVQGMTRRESAPEVVFNLDPLQLSSKAATHIGLLFNEVLSHRLRQLRHEEGRALLELSVYEDGEQAVFQIRDNGPSRDESTGVSAIELQILEALVRQVEGQAEYPESPGFEMRIRVPNRALTVA